MKRGFSGGLVPLSAVARKPDRAAQAEARLEARLKRAWLLVVGPTLVHQTCLIRVHRGILLVGCWHPDIIPSLRASAETIWPQLQVRLERLWKRHFQRLEIVPCDPPQSAATPERRPERDSLAEVLNLLREQGKGGWTPKPR